MDFESLISAMQVHKHKQLKLKYLDPLLKTRAI